MAAHQAPPSLGFSRQEHWSGLPFPSPMNESEKWSRSVAQSCLTLSDPMDCSPPGSSIHRIFQARVLEWGAIAFSWLLHGCLHIWNSSHILQSLLTAHSNVSKLLPFCSWTTAQRADESLQDLQSGSRSVYLLPDAQLGEMSPGSLGVWCWIQQLAPRHLYSWMTAELLLLLGGEK